jgi:DNA-binding beta-propeller fold protein YncE
MDKPQGLAYDSTGKRLFVGEYNNNRVLVFNVTSITDGEAALRVLGQSVFTTGTAATTSAAMKQPLGLSYDASNGRLFLADKGNHRVLFYDVDILSNGQAAAYELGQGSFISKSTSATARGLSGARGSSVDSVNHRLFVADTANNRVLIYNTDVTDNGAAAVNVLGQASFTTSASGHTSTTMDGPTAVLYDPTDELLYVADTGNNRVLVYDAEFITDGDAALRVLGQTNFTNNAAATTAVGESAPADLALDSEGTRLFVADTGNHRVLVYDVAAITNGETAVNVFGQLLFTNATTGITAEKLNGPSALSYDASDDRLFVADTINNRIIVYDTSSISDGESAIFVVGQADFVSNTAGMTASTLSGPTGVVYDSANSRLYISDGTNNRVLIYDGAEDLSSALTANYVIGQSDFTTATSGLTSMTLHGPRSLIYDSEKDRLYISDTTNNRILFYDIQ